MKRRFFSLLSALLISLLFSGCGRSVYAGPERAVKAELDLIRQTDKNTILEFLSTNTEGALNEEKLAATAELLFENFEYEIVSSRQSKDAATASVKAAITNIDAQALARDMYRMLLSDADLYEEHLEAYYELTSYLDVMYTCLSENTYPLQKTYVTFQLANDSESSDAWSIIQTEQLADEVLGGLLGYLSDTDLLTPEEVLALTLDKFKEMDADTWKDYLNVHNILQVEAADYGELDNILLYKLAAVYDYSIDKVTQEADRVSAAVTITGVDINAVINAEKEALLAYARTTESVRAEDDALAQKAYELLKEALEAASSVDTQIELIMIHTGYCWETVFDDTFTNALLGNPKDISGNSQAESESEAN